MARIRDFRRTELPLPDLAATTALGARIAGGLDARRCRGAGGRSGRRQDHAGARHSAALGVTETCPARPSPWCRPTTRRACRQPLRSLSPEERARDGRAGPGRSAGRRRGADRMAGARAKPLAAGCACTCDLTRDERDAPRRPGRAGALAEAWKHALMSDRADGFPARAPAGATPRSRRCRAMPPPGAMCASHRTARKAMLMDQPQSAETPAAPADASEESAARWATMPWRGWRAPIARASSRSPNYLRAHGLGGAGNLCRRSRQGFVILEDLGDALFADVLARRRRRRRTLQARRRGAGEAACRRAAPALLAAGQAAVSPMTRRRCWPRPIC